MTEEIDRSDELLEWYGEDNPDGAELLDDIDDYLARFVVYPSEHERRAHALWIAHTWLMECWESTPRFAFLSPEPGSGKSRALEVTFGAAARARRQHHVGLPVSEGVGP
jgi:hypothetical protein